MPLRLSLPKRFLSADIGLGDIVKRGAASIRVKPCASCRERAERLNRLLVLAPMANRELHSAPTLALPPFEGAATAGASASAASAAAEKRPLGSGVQHLPVDEGTPEVSERCCTFSLTLINKRLQKPAWWPSVLWPWPQATAVRVTGTAGTTILNASPDEWDQVANLPGSVTWAPGTGGALPLGDPADSWIIDNDFLLSLGPVSSGLKTVTIEWLAASGVALDVFQVSIPCDLSDKEEPETDWAAYTTVVSGGRCISLYLEPDDCDAGDFDYRAPCNMDSSSVTCATDNSGNAAYSVTYTAPSSPPCWSYQWTVNSTPQNSQTDTLTVVRPPGSYTVGLVGLDSGGGTVFECCAEAALDGPKPDFSWQVDGCTKIVTLDASITQNPDDVVSWNWTCSEAAVQIPPGIQSEADFFDDGLYKITLHVTDSYGCEWEQSYQVTVGGCTPTWEPKYNWCVGQIDKTVHADIQVKFNSTPAGCAPFTWQWSFDDNDATIQNPNTSNQPNPSHTYMTATDGDVHNVTLTLKDSKGCSSTVTIPLTITQRLAPAFSIKVCPDGKVVCETNESHPVWSASGSYSVAPWPYTKPKKHQTRIIYLYQSTGNYVVTMTDTNDEGNECTARQEFSVQLDCCRKNTHKRDISAPLSVQVNGKATTLRVKGKLRQTQGPVWHRVIAKTILQKQSKFGFWYRYKSHFIELEADFGGHVYRSEWQPLAFDGSFFKGCRCAIEDPTLGVKQSYNKKKIRAVDGLGHAYRSKFQSIKSEHGVTVNAINYPLLYLSLGKDAECDGATWWI